MKLFIHKPRTWFARPASLPGMPTLSAGRQACLVICLAVMTLPAFSQNDSTATSD